MPNVPTASAITTPDKTHSPAKGPSANSFVPSFFNPVPVAAVLKGGTVGTAYSETITAQGGTSPYTYAVTSGSLPAGLSLSSSGVISGTPTTAATSNFTITVTDANGFTGSQAFQITIATPSNGGNFCIIA